MLEPNVRTAAQKYVFRPLAEEKIELFTNKDVERFATDEFCRYELIGGEIIVSTAPRYIHQLLTARLIIQFSKYLEACAQLNINFSNRLEAVFDRRSTNS